VIDFSEITKNDMKYNKEALKNECGTILVGLIKQRNEINDEIGEIKRFLNKLEGK
jgi:chorismate mutase